MGLFSKLFGKQKSEGISSNSINLAFYEALIEVIAVSDELKSELKTNIKIAYNDPASFYDDSRMFTLSDRGLSYSVHKAITPKFVMIETMAQEGQMAEVDWKEDEEEVRTSVIEVLKAKEYDISFSANCKYQMETFETIQAIDKNELQPLGYCLEMLDINSDSYVFTIVPVDKKQIVRSMFDKLK